MKYLLIIAIVTLSSCATEGKLQENMRSWVGRDINSLIDQAGAPSQTFKKPNGDTVYIWLAQGSTTATALYGVVNIENNFCNLSYTADQSGIIQRWQYQGNSCRIR